MPIVQTPEHDYMPLAGGALIQHVRARHGLVDDAEIVEISLRPGNLQQWHLDQHQQTSADAEE